jgi:epsilon-lactone hydrolase
VRGRLGILVGMSGDVLPFPQAADGVEVKHLRAFVAVAEELNFSRAAERLFLSQPALSRQIRTLERLVGCELLRRSTHRVELTLAGDALLDRARPLLADLDEAVAATQSVGGELAGRIARLWEPLNEVAADANLQDMRTEYEALLARLSPPPETDVRPLNAGGVPSFLVTSAPERRPTLLYLHGGGYMMGSAYGFRGLVGALALEAQTGALVPEYRLAPEHPFPAAVEDATRAYLWLVDHANDPRELTVAGDSAGAGLVLSLLLTLKQQDLPLPGGVVLFCPSVDLTTRNLEPHGEAEQTLLEIARRVATAYLAGHPIEDPLLSPLSADLSGLPPMLIQAATGDPVVADAHDLTARAREHGVDARLELYPGATHDFQLFWSFLPEAADALRQAGRFARPSAAERSASAGS